MDEFSGDGVFWLDGREDRVAGTLTFTSEQGIKLDLIGGFDELTGSFPKPAELLRIHGVAGKKLVTLVNAQQSGSEFNIPGVRRETYQASVLLVGGNLATDTSLHFRSVSVRVANLSSWIGRTGVNMSIEAPDDGVPSRVLFDFRPIPAEHADLPDGGGEVEIGFSWSTGGNNLVESYIRQGTYVRLKPREPVDLDGVFRFVNAVRDLLSLAANASCSVLEVTLFHPEMVDERGPEPRPIPLTMYARLVNERKVVERQTWDMLFTYEQLGGVDGVAKWVSLSAELQSVIGSLMSVRHSESIYSENRMQNVALAAESLHRIRFPNEVLPPDDHAALVARLLLAVPEGDREWLEKRLEYSNEPRLRKRLRDLADFAGPAFADFVDNTRQWSFVVAKVRNALTHYQGAEPRLEGLFYLSESVYLLVALCLMRLAGANEALLRAATANRHVQWLKDPLAEAIEAAR